MSNVQPMKVSPTSSLLGLKYPQSVAVFDTYEQAQKAVDFLSDERFPVENLCIVGTDLKLVERVLGRRGWPQVLSQGAVSGLGTGVLIGFLWWAFVPDIGLGSGLVLGILVGIVFGMLSASLAYAATRGQRDFSSVSSTVATRYEVLGEHNVVQQARELLARMSSERPGGGHRGVQAGNAPSAQQPYGNQPPVAQPYGQQPVEQSAPPAYGQGYGRYGQQSPYGQQPYSQPSASQPYGEQGRAVQGYEQQGYQQPEAPRTPPAPQYSPWPQYPSEQYPSETYSSDVYSSEQPSAEHDPHQSGRGGESGTGGGATAAPREQ